ncbi:YjjG family noncanonical pyrimidine nucleotidase [Ureibacillus sp. 179-F W5.1 NHS]|uniref:Noncanonical pyrimidine nucleotidase, YjjG family n=1 Tax=Lysinibacillus halotolerans TaxID=1368476 RepID=A0A3M8H7P3_9BACI|nr:YjjG family noncanonical pyrimidine nucleotidase [Lysinibacillus halotolerans]RNC98289.1 noncanonical pyrimidine nucleotidase, YjjG family [Lysinibacillus halotolerans]
MKQYKTLLFDLDDTLLDFGATEEVALQKLFSHQQVELTPEIKANYKKLNRELWRAYEEDQMDRDEVVNTRFAILFKQYGIEVDGVALEKNYRKYLSEGHHLIEGALNLIKTLHKQFDLYVVSNGESKTQEKRLHDSGLAPYFKKVFVSEDTGYQKPMKEFFHVVFSQIENLDLTTTLIIGDSFSADITGGWNVGIDTCWINHKQITMESDITPTYEITKLEELYKILQVNQ